MGIEEGDKVDPEMEARIAKAAVNICAAGCGYSGVDFVGDVLEKGQKTEVDIPIVAVGGSGESEEEILAMHKCMVEDLSLALENGDLEMVPHPTYDGWFTLVFKKK